MLVPFPEDMLAYRGIFFDVDGTLIGLRPEAEAIYRQVCQEYGLDYAGLTEARATALAFLQRHGLAYLDDEPAMWRAAHREVFLHLGAGEQAEACAARVQELFRAQSEYFLYPDVRPALEALQERGYLLGALTGRLHSSEHLLVELGIRPYFVFYLYAGALGVLKPDPRFYQEALRRAGLPAAAVLLVGDQPSDAQGAISVGMTPLLIARRKEHLEEGEIGDLRELPAWLERRVHHGDAKEQRESTIPAGEGTAALLRSPQ